MADMQYFCCDSRVFVANLAALLHVMRKSRACAPQRTGAAGRNDCVGHVPRGVSQPYADLHRRVRVALPELVLVGERKGLEEERGRLPI